MDSVATPPSTERVNEMLEEAGRNHAKIYQAICYGMRHIDSSPIILTEKIGKSRGWLSSYRYVVELTGLSFSALHANVIGSETAKLLSELTDGDQDACVNHILKDNLLDGVAKTFVSEKIADTSRVTRIVHQLRQEWPEKKLVPLPGKQEVLEVTPPAVKAASSFNNEESCPERKEIGDRWLESTEGIRENGFMPRELSIALFGNVGFFGGDTDLSTSSVSPSPAIGQEVGKVVIRSLPVPGINGSVNGHGNGSEKHSTETVYKERTFLPHVIGNEFLVAGIVWILCQVLKLLTRLASVSAPKLAAAMLDPVDETRIKLLTRQIGDQVALIEDLLVVAARHRPQ